VRPQDRIALSGPNGSGKSTLLRLMLDQAELAPDRILFMPQEISIAESSRITARIRALDSDEKGDIYSAVDRLGADLQSIMETDLPSPGEIRKLLLAEGLARRPAWVVMDEPTNHLDVFSIRHVETALAGFDGALLLVSHDRRFLDNLRELDWNIKGDADTGNWRLTVS
jgi:ATPase subunit of ABC transporter with duplicated ATPase domains